MLDRNQDTVKQVHETFVRILNALKAKPDALNDMDTERLDSIVGTAMSGEEPIAFDSLITNLDDYEVEVDEQTKKDLRFLAEAFDELENPAGKGHYW